MKIKLSTATLGFAGFVVALMGAMAITSSATVPVYAAAAQNQTTKETSKETDKEVVVQPGDTLTAIAEASQTTYARLFSANVFIQDPNIIHPGEKLHIPAPDETLTDRPLPAEASTTVATTAAVTVSAPSPTPVQPVASTTSAGVWDNLAQCESGGNWAISTGNGYYGGLQFTVGTWQGLGGAGYPNQASKAEQISRAQMLVNRSGWGSWPACAAKLGLR